MRKHNIPLIIGIVIILLLISILVFKNDLIKFDPYSIQIGDYEVIDGEMVYAERPAPPSENHPFGTDMLGRDIYSQIIFGAGITLKLVFLVVIFRFLLAIPFGIVAGFGNKFFIKIIQFFSITFSAIPALLLCIILLNSDSIKMLELNQSIMIFATVLTFVGWGRIANTIQGHTNEILNRDFIQGEIAIGKNNIMIAIQNVLPHMLASIIVLVLLELGNALLMIAELGVFGIYVGKPTMDADALDFLGMSNAILPSSHPEWGGMLASARYAVTSRKFWVIVYPALAFFITIIGFNLFGEGIKYEIEKRNSKVITWIKRIINQFSIMTFIYEIKNFREYKRNIAIKISIILLICAIPLLPSPESKYVIDGEKLWEYVNELNCDEYTGRLVESEESRNTREYLENKLELINIKPFFDTYTSNRISKKTNYFRITNESLEILGEEKNFVYGEDFITYDMFLNVSGNSFKIEFDELIKSLTGEIITTDQLITTDYKKYDVERDYDINNTKFLLFDNSEDWNTNLREKIYDRNDVKIVFYEEEFLFRKPNVRALYSPSGDDGGGGALAVYIKPEVAQELRRNVNNTCTINWDCKMIENYEVANVAGIIEGKSNENPILITTNYDNYGKDCKGIYDDITSIAALLEIGDILANNGDIPEQSIILAFTDASKYDNDGAKALSLNKQINENTFFINLNYLGLSDYPEINFDTAYLASKINISTDLIKYIEKRSKQLGLESNRETYRVEEEESFIYTSRGSSGLVIKGISAEGKYKYESKKQNDISQINRNLLEKQVQAILDIIVNIAYE